MIDTLDPNLSNLELQTLGTTLNTTLSTILDTALEGYDSYPDEQCLINPLVPAQQETQQSSNARERSLEIDLLEDILGF